MKKLGVIYFLIMVVSFGKVYTLGEIDAEYRQDGSKIYSELEGSKLINGQIEETITHKIRTIDGSPVFKELKTLSEVKNGILDGEVVSYYENGEVYRKTTYKNGVREGSDVTYHENGEVFMKLTFRDDKIVDGEYGIYSHGGELIQKEYYAQNEFTGKEYL